MANAIHASTLAHHDTKQGDWCDYSTYSVKFTISRKLTDFATGTVTAEGAQRLEKAFRNNPKLARGYRGGDLHVTKIEAHTMSHDTMHTPECVGLMWVEYCNSIGD